MKNIQSNPSCKEKWDILVEYQLNVWWGEMIILESSLDIRLSVSAGVSSKDISQGVWSEILRAERDKITIQQVFNLTI